MSAVGLMFVGAVLFVNGLLLLGRIDSKGAATFNLFVGALQVAIPFYLIATAPNTSDILLDSGIFLFGFTYLYVGISNLAGQPATGLGWYSAWVAIMATAFGITNIVKFSDPTIGLLWLQWAVLWALFFVVLALGKDTPHPADRLADADPLVHHLHHPRLPAAARRVGPGADLAGAGGHRGHRGRAAAHRQPDPARGPGDGGPGRGRCPGVRALIRRWFHPGRPGPVGNAPPGPVRHSRLVPRNSRAFGKEWPAWNDSRVPGR